MVATEKSRYGCCVQGSQVRGQFGTKRIWVEQICARAIRSHRVFDFTKCYLVLLTGAGSIGQVSPKGGRICFMQLPDREL